jgi:glycosyltransferase involved in cell wall biosynthesis
MSARVPDETIVVSRTLSEQYADRFKRNVVYIPNGVDRPAQLPQKLLSEFDLEPNRYVLFVGRMVPEKAPAALLAAFRGLDTDLRLVLAGGSSFTDTYTEEVRKLAAEDPRVSFLGFVHGDKLQALYQYARLFVLPSLLEGLPLTLLEALSHGIPVVASDIPPHLEVLGEKPLGHAVFRSGNVQSLQQVLGEALTTEPRLSPDVAEFRDAILEKYDWDQAVETLEQVYLKVAAT